MTSLTWRMLEHDDYYLVISVPDRDPSCCLTGDISVFTFDAPRCAGSACRRSRDAGSADRNRESSPPNVADAVQMADPPFR